MLAAHHAGGITKKSKSGRKAVLSSKARQRQEKSLDRAEAVVERTLKKVQRSKGQAQSLNTRRKTWDEINNDILDRAPVAGSKKKAAKAAEDAAVAAFFADGDEEMEDLEEQQQQEQGEGPEEEDVSASTPLPPLPEDDEVL